MKMGFTDTIREWFFFQIQSSTGAWVTSASQWKSWLAWFLIIMIALILLVFAFSFRVSDKDPSPVYDEQEMRAVIDFVKIHKAAVKIPGVDDDYMEEDNGSSSSDSEEDE